MSTHIYLIKKLITISFYVSLCLGIHQTQAQLGFCGGNSGDPIFTEDFGTGTNNNPLPAGTTTYAYSEGFPNDGFYTVSNGTSGNGFDWHQIQDHTPNDVNGKCLIVNAGFSAGEFYRTTVSGLCESTTYEFSAWLINLVIAGGFCSTQPLGTIPINVRFEIWDGTDTNLLASGNTGNIFETNSPNWQEYGLVFQTLVGQNTVILKMINNGQGGCGNDLAIDDIEFKSCGDTISVEDSSNNDSVSLCSADTPFNTTITAIPDNTVFSNHFYQWQESTDGIIWTDIAGSTAQDLILTGVIVTTSYRAKVAEFAANVNNVDCNTFSDIYEVSVTQAPNAPTINCWQTVMFNNAICDWEVTGTQPAAPTGLECWETATFNNTTCLWEITGTQPAEPTGLECWETTTFNDMTCVWDISGTQPGAPTGLECWETTTFNNTSCTWEVTGTQPIPPTGLECWETATFNNTTCLWELTGSQPTAPIDLECWETTTFNNTTCTWEVSGTQPAEPTNVNCWDDFQFNDITCEWDNIGTENSIPIIESVSSDGNSIVITTSNTGDFEYSADGILYQSGNVLFSLEGGQYTVYVRARNGCGVDTAEYLHFVIPRFFTPNGDTFKDSFDLKGIEFYESNEVYIFDRYGKLLKSSKNLPFKWNGIFNGQLLPSSDYWYIIIIEGQRFAGHLTLKR